MAAFVKSYPWRPTEVATVLAAVLAAGPGAVAGAPAVHIDWSVNGGPVNSIWPDGVDSGAFSYQYEGMGTDPGTGVMMSYDLLADPYASLGGNVGVFNHLNDDIDLTIAVVMDFTPIFPDGSDLSGQVTVGLTTGPGGGQLGSQPPALWQAVIDDAVVGAPTTMFYHPFYISNSGQGSSSTQANFGIPNPVPGPPVMESLGYTLSFSLTPLDTGSITSSFGAAGEPLTCTGDLDTSGVLDTEDVLALLADWGPCLREGCDADVDGDNEVGITDLLWLLANWGPCP